MLFFYEQAFLGANLAIIVTGLQSHPVQFPFAQRSGLYE